MENKKKSDLVLSLFPGIGMLDMGFESEGFTIVRGPDLLWGGDINSFHPPSRIFKGIIGGPPCQAHVRYAAMNRAIGNKVAPDLIPEFIRVVIETECDWFLMENSSLVNCIKIDGYKVQELILNAALFGLEQNRKRKFQFGSREGKRIKVEILPLSVPQELEKTCLASEGASGIITRKNIEGSQKSFYKPRRSWNRFLELQGLPVGFLDESPFTIEGKYKVVGNGVPLPMAKAIANAVLRSE